MCIFSQSVERVSDTNIYARMIGDSQILVYEMRIASKTDLAMVLPLPVKSASEKALSFIDLSGYVQFFDDMAQCFPALIGFLSEPVAAGIEPMLVVHRVGAFEASFVPTLRDFVRLDPRFRLPDDVWSSLPVYQDYGFAVFQLAGADARIHPMAMRFETRNAEALYFPTTHVHDGSVHPEAEFDHTLYVQGASEATEWKPSSILPREVMALRVGLLRRDRTQGTVAPDAPISRRILRGRFPNGDIWFPVRNIGESAVQ